MDSSKLALRVGVIAYLVLVIGPVALKLLRCWPLTWWEATAALWVPAGFTVLFLVFSVLAWGFYRKEPAV